MCGPLSYHVTNALFLFFTCYRNYYKLKNWTLIYGNSFQLSCFALFVFILFLSISFLRHPFPRVECFFETFFSERYYVTSPRFLIKNPLVLYLLHNKQIVSLFHSRQRQKSCQPELHTEYLRWVPSNNPIIFAPQEEREKCWLFTGLEFGNSLLNQRQRYKSWSYPPNPWITSPHVSFLFFILTNNFEVMSKNELQEWHLRLKCRLYAGLFFSCSLWKSFYEF